MSTRWIFFDVDQTLCDFAAVRQRALAETLQHIRRQVGTPAARELTEKDLQRARDDVAAMAPPTMSMEAIRKAALEAVVQKIAPSSGSDVAVGITDFYFSRRFADPVVFPDVLPTLRELLPVYRLGVITNGNSYVDRLGLDEIFSEIVMAHDIGHRKPDRRIYEFAAQRVGMPSHALVMVGDSLEEDVNAAVDAGWRAVWLRRTGEGVPPEHVPAVTSLRQLPSTLRSLRSDPA